MAEPLTQAERDALGPFIVKPHPDGKPWDKCCGNKGDTECMCLMRKPRNNPSRFTWLIGSQWNQSVVHLMQTKGRFFCCHRTTKDGYNRECAGWAAKFGHRRDSCASKQETSI